LVAVTVTVVISWTLVFEIENETLVLSDVLSVKGSEQM
jgi:hypothetical protein